MIEPRNAINGKVDGLILPEDNMIPAERARMEELPRGRRARHVYPLVTQQLGRPWRSSAREVLFRNLYRSMANKP
ncbi:hypothetical protein BK146_33630 [Paenibacillus sp. FSL R7-0333]|nr:hypothetical protein BK146_33630 [Paenibacillus sp. FSL R7-0333]